MTPTPALVAGLTALVPRLRPPHPPRPIARPPCRRRPPPDPPDPPDAHAPSDSASLAGRSAGEGREGPGRPADPSGSPFSTSPVEPARTKTATEEEPAEKPDEGVEVVPETDAPAAESRPAELSAAAHRTGTKAPSISPTGGFPCSHWAWGRLWWASASASSGGGRAAAERLATARVPLE